MKVCPSCGSELADELSFCPSDGSPLLSAEEEAEPAGQEDVGEATIVMPDIGEKTVVMGSEESEEIETEVPDRDSGADSEPVGDATLVMSDLPESGEPPVTEEYGSEASPAPPAETMYAGAEQADQPEAVAGDTEDWVEETQDVTADTPSTEEWEEEVPEAEQWEEEPDEEEQVGIPAAAAAATADSGDGAPPEKSRSKLGLIVALIALFMFFVVILVGAGGIWWYLSSRSADTADANVNGEISNTEDGNLASGGDLTGDEDTPMPEESPEESPDTSATASPSPSASRTPRSPTPTPTATRTPVGQQTPRTTPTRTPVRTPTPPRSTPTPQVPSRISGGVVNGKAISLPKPAYPAAARAVNARGNVNVAVVIDRNGRVVSANATSGHPLLRGAAESAARRARFRPTLLSGQPVEVSGVIVYNFN